MGIRLSIVVPIYNVAKYLPKCLDSLLDQDIPLTEYEIILVDDGSTDGSEGIADQYSAIHSNISVIHQLNKGLSAARNVGLKIACGEYIQFVDSDDYLEPNVLKKLVEKMDNDHLDVLRFDYLNINEDYEVFQPNKDYKPFVDFRDKICSGTIFLNERLGYACYAWQFMIKGELLVKGDVLFKEGIYFEDSEWAPRMLSQACRVTSIDTIVYNYLMRQGSITTAATAEKKKKVLEDKFGLIEELLKQFESARDVSWYHGMIAFTTLSILSLISLDYYTERRGLVNRLESLNIFPLSFYHMSDRVIKKVKFANFSPRLYCAIVHYKNII